ncbi:MAG: hypothetical protein CMJ78_08175 [Planctomycetaceae bacterium]|nr:hypothetical protein [Planctomycetaceae bacterium]
MRRFACVSLVPRLSLLAGIILSASYANAQLPQARLNSVFPPGGQVGTSVDIGVTSSADNEELGNFTFNHPGIKFVNKDGKNTVTIDANVKPGIYEVRATGMFGTTNPRAFVVGRRKEAREAEPNNNSTQATAIELDSVVNGQVNGGADLDFFKFTAKKGQRVVVTCAGGTIDSRIRPTIEVYNSKRRRLAFDQHQVFRDPSAAVVIPEDGDYFVKVFDYVFGGSVDHFYRLTVHTGPHISYVIPAAGQPNTTGKFTLYGHNLPNGKPAGVKLGGIELQKAEVQIPVPAVSGLDSSIYAHSRQSTIDGFAYRLDTPKGESNAVLIGFSNGPITIEQEPNNEAAQSQKMQVPGEYAGQFQQRGDIDYVSFDAKKGDVYWLEVVAQRQGVLADPYLIVEQVVKDAEGKETTPKRLTAQDDNGNNPLANHFDLDTDDPVYKFTAPADGTFRAVIRDRYFEARGRVDLTYRLIVRNEAPDFRVIVVAQAPLQGTNNNTAGTWPVGLRKGDQFAVRVAVLRQDGFNEPVEVSAQGLPKGVTCKPIMIDPKQPSAILVLEAAEDAPVGMTLAKFVGRAMTKDATAEKAYTDSIAAVTAANAAITKAIADVAKLTPAVKPAKDAKNAAEAKSTADAKVAADAAKAKVTADKAATDTAAAAKAAVTAQTAAAKKLTADTAAANKADTDLNTASKKVNDATTALTNATNAQKAADANAKKLADAAKAAATKLEEETKKLANDPKKDEKLAPIAKAKADADKAAADAAKDAQTKQATAVAAKKTLDDATKNRATVDANRKKARETVTASTKAKAAADKKVSDTAAAAKDAANAKGIADKKAADTAKVATASAEALKKAVAALTTAQNNVKAANDTKVSTTAKLPSLTQAVKTTNAARKKAMKPMDRVARVGTIQWTGNQTQPAIARVCSALTVSVLDEQAPFQLTTDVYKFDVNRNRQILIPFKLKKRNGFDNNVTLTFVGQPKNMQVQNKPINKGKDSEVLRIFVPANVAPGTYSLYVRTQGQVPYRRNLKRLERAKEAQTKATEAAKVAADALAKSKTANDAATKKVTDTVNALKKVTTDRDNAKKASDAAVAAEKKATDAKTAADKAATDSAAKAKTALDAFNAADKAAKDATAAAAKAAEADKAKADADAKAATAKAAEAKKASDAAAAEVKKATDAQTAAKKALETAQANSAKAAQTLKTAEAAVTKADGESKAATAEKTKTDAAFKAATEKDKAAKATKTAADNEVKAADGVAKAKNINIFPPSTPFVINIKPEPATLAAAVPGGGAIKRGNKIEVKVTVNRANGFAGPATLSLPLPPGVTGLKANPVTIPADQKEGVLVIEAAGDATEGALANMVVQAKMEFNGEPAAVDQPITLKVSK